MRQSGLEWIYRLIQEPRRLFRRYVNDLWIFSWSILAQWWALQFRKDRSDIAATQTKSCSSCANHHIIMCPPKLDAAAAEADAPKTADILADERHCFLQMAAVSSIDSTGMGYLIGLRKKLQGTGRELVLLAPSEPVRRALKLMRINEFFFSAPDLATAQYLLQVRAREQSAAVTLRTAAAVTPLVWHGEITAANAEQVWENTRAYLETARTDRKYALDLSELRFIDSSGLGVLVRAKKLTHRQDAKLVLLGLQPAVRNVVRIARLESFLQIEHAPEPKPIPKRSPTWREILTLPESNIAPAGIFGASHNAILSEPVTNSGFVTSNE
jgi:N-acetylglucosaminyldiphosphoundecaprenol N-acetyl-beta-D-mannosaminyltransferase